MEELTPPSVAVVIVVQSENGDFLLGKRKGKHRRGDGQYAMPGGKKEPNETTFQCCSRELLEETGIDRSFADIDFVGVFYDNSEKDKGFNFITFIYSLEINTTIDKVKNMEPDKCYGWEWFPLEHINTEKMNLFTSVLGILDIFLSK